MIVTDLTQITPGAIIARERSHGEPYPPFVVDAIGSTGPHTAGCFPMGEDLETSLLVDLVHHRSNESSMTLLRDSRGRICDWAGSQQLDAWKPIARKAGWDWCERYALVPIHLITPEPPRNPQPIQLDLFGGAA